MSDLCSLDLVFVDGGSSRMIAVLSDLVMFRHGRLWSANGGLV